MVAGTVTIAISVIGWFAGPAISKLIEKIDKYRIKRQKWIDGLPEKLDSVANFLEEISSTVRLVREQRINDPSMLNWSLQLKDAIDEVEDMFDQFDYEILKNQAGGGGGSSAEDFTLGSGISSDRLKKLVGKLDEIRQSSRGLVQASLLAATAGCFFDDPSSSRSVTGPLLPHKTFGYKEEYENLKKYLLSHDQDARVVAVVGHGGMGKTTLAQRAWNDKDVGGKFDIAIWACMYNKLKEQDIMTEIWGSARIAATADAEADKAGGSATSGTLPLPLRQGGGGEVSFSSLQLALHKLVKSKKFLLVLDDVCHNEMDTELQTRETWSNVLAPFKSGDGKRPDFFHQLLSNKRESGDSNRGSRILVTTRAMICADTLGAGKIVRLDGIDNDSVISLLEDQCGQITYHKDILKANVEKLKGSPLATKEVALKLTNARYVQAESSRREWEDIFKQTDCHQSVVSAHMSSYHHLPPRLQGCLAFCSLFPDGWEFDPDMLVKMWIAHGFIVGDCLDGKSMEDVARRYIAELISRSFFEHVTDQDGKKIDRYVIHEQIHSMIRSACANFFMMITQGNCAKKVPLTVRHLSVSCVCLAQLRRLRVLKRLRTLLVFGDPNSDDIHDIDKQVFSQLESVRVLDLTGTGIADLPKFIGKLIHLRYLALPEKLLQERIPPAPVTKLFHLQTLIGSNDCRSAFRFVARNGLQHLAAMNSLRGELKITGLEDVESKERAQMAQIAKKKYVTVLELEWGRGDETIKTVKDHDILEGLQPHTGLEGLKIKRYRGTCSPTLLSNSSLEQLTHLYLVNCRNWVVLPSFGFLPRLSHLEIREMLSVRQIDGTGPFDYLETLVLHDMKNLVEWTTSTDSGSRFTVLSKLEICYCPSLEKLACHMPASLKSLKIRDASGLNNTIGADIRKWKKMCTELQVDVDFKY